VDQPRLTYIDRTSHVASPRFLIVIHYTEGAATSRARLARKVFGSLVVTVFRLSCYLLSFYLFIEYG
jgi:hypothetical protein